MGLLGSKKKTFVSSVVYNMAGDVKDRPNYLKTMTVGRVLRNTPTKTTATRDRLDSYLRGPGISLRHFGPWARQRGYNANVGIVSSAVSLISELDTDLLQQRLEIIFGKTIYLNEAQIGITDFGMWATQYMLANHADKYLTDWAADFDEAAQQIILKIPGMAVIRFTPTGYVARSQYLYASLNQEKNAVSDSQTSNWIRGETPSVIGYEQITSTDVSTQVALQNTTVVSQTVDGGAPVLKTFENPSTQTVTVNNALYTKRTELPDAASAVVVGGTTLSIESREVYEVITTITTETLTEPLASGLRVSVITKTTDTIHKYNEYRTSVVTVREKAWENEQLYIYRRGSGNAALDAFFTSSSVAGTFYPIIPIRLDNKFVTDDAHAAILPWIKKAVRRSTNFSFEKLLEIVEDNPSLRDIDYAYMIFGTSLNTPEDTAKRYIYEFFSNIGGPSSSMIDQFWSDYDAAIASWDAWVKWYTQGRYEYRNVFGGVVVQEPVRLPLPTLPVQTISIYSPQNYNIAISYSGVTEQVIAGKYEPTSRIGNVRIYKGSSKILASFPEQYESNQVYNRWNRLPGEEVQTIIIDWQNTHTSFRRMTITGLTHVNNIYGNKSVTITAWEALDDNEESGFIIPLQEETLAGLPLTVTTQLCTATTYMMFNCYQIVKQKWYQTGLFKLVLIVITIVITVLYPPAGAASAAGLLGSNAVIGAAIGFSGTAAIVAGAIANAIVAMVVAEVITKASVALFGDKIGNIIGAITSFVTISVGVNMAGGQPLAASFGNMVNAENLMRLTTALSDGISSYIRASAMETQADITDVMEDYQEQAKKLSERYLQEFGGDNGVIDPLAVADVMQFRLEDPAMFLDRTLMNGTDIADMSHDMLDNFTNLTVALPLE